MQYLLSEEEMEEIRQQQKELRSIPVGGRHLLEGLTNVCRMVATTMIPTQYTARSGARDKPHGCIHVDKSARYCDKCPVSGICPQTKQWSK